MSLSKIRKVTEEGVHFQSHIDGSRHMLTPERAVEIQCLLGSDIQMQLDECIELPAERGRAEEAMELSLRWAERARTAFARQASPARPCSRSCRAARTPSCGGARPRRSSAWIFRATRSAASRSARGRS